MTDLGPGHGVGFIVRDIYAWLVVHDDGDEAIPAIPLPDGTRLPLIAADPIRLDEIRPMAKMIAERSGKPLRLVRFTHREEVEVISP